MKQFTYQPKGVCASSMNFSIDGDKIEKVEIIGGCPGNLLGISKMLEQKTIAETIKTFEGVKCGNKQTSCPEQIAFALKQYLEKQE